MTRADHYVCNEQLIPTSEIIVGRQHWNTPLRRGTIIVVSSSPKQKVLNLPRGKRLIEIIAFNYKSRALLYFTQLSLHSDVWKCSNHNGSSGTKESTGDMRVIA